MSARNERKIEPTDPDNSGTEAAQTASTRKGRHRPPSEGSRVDEAYVRILALITEGKLGVGERLPSEGELATTIAVSRPVIRQALGRLQYAGVVKIRWGAGTFVQDASRAASGGPTFGPVQSLDEVRQVYTFRSTIEGDAAALAAEQRLADPIAAAHRALAMLEKTLGTSNEAKQADLEFHLAISAACGNPYYWRVLRSIQQSVEFSISLTRTLSLTHPHERRLLVQAEHVAVLDGIEAGDPERARNAMRLHLSNACRRLFQGPMV
jgi:GntR family transcriptional regulator, transcriptional repressor for pyruvate dehydrogenase complex